MNMVLSDTQKAAAFDRLITEGKISVSDVEIFLNDFTNTLARAIERKLSHFKEPLFENPTTGKTASSAHAVLKALNYDMKLHWGVLARSFQGAGGKAVFTRRDLPRPVWANSNHGTLCVDLEEVDRLLLQLQPKKAQKVIDQFKAAEGLR